MNKGITVGGLLATLLVLALVASTATAAYFYKQMTIARVQSKWLGDQLSKANYDLRETKKQLEAARSALGQTQSQLSAARSALGQTQSQLGAAQREIQQRLQTIFAQQQNVQVLKTCLAGVAADDVYFRAGVKYFFQWFDSRDDDDLNQAAANFREGRDILDSVSSDCDKAAALFK
jgi:septal ring factor EnvC (AmiA/AmiB activator)